jgi:hypothetical protein
MDILAEQLVYGSFPFWERGYDVLARSPGCRAEWVSDLLAACRNLGEAPSGITPARALFALRLPSGPWAIVGVEPQGLDDRGRPGALAFHALLVQPADYRKAGSNPFRFIAALRRDWSPETSLDAVFCTLEVDSPSTRTEARTARIVEALADGRRVAIESPEPIDRLARDVWPSLPEPTRRKASVATWAFGNANRFDLVALPRLAGVEFDRSYLDLASIDAAAPPAKLFRRLTRPRLSHPLGWAIGVAVLSAAGLAWWVATHPRPIASQAPLEPGPAPPETRPPITPEQRSQIVDGLEALADEFDVGGSNDPGALMARLAEQLHYRGPTLTPAELAKLAREADPDRDRALAWHERLTRTFAADRPLPENFTNLPFDRQLERLAWSFHLDPSTPLGAIPEALARTLGRQGVIRPTPLAARYPPLTDYARFLGKLPRRSSQ